MSQTGENDSTRKIEYAGEIHKCPNCGAVLESFVKACPECGYELRGAKATTSVKEFGRIYSKAKKIEKKIDLIKTYAIPNNKEDIVEFAILASTNIDPRVYLNRDNSERAIAKQELCDAWMVKYEQVYQKASITLVDDPILENINNQYFKKRKKVKKVKTMSEGKARLYAFFSNKFVKYVLIPVIVIGIGFLVVYMIHSHNNKQFNNLLNTQKTQVESYISEGKFDEALDVVQSMDTKKDVEWGNIKSDLKARINYERASKEHPEGVSQVPPKNNLTKDSEGKDRQAKDVKSQLEKLNFSDITIETAESGVWDSISNFFTKKKGEVKEVEVDGSTDYNPNEWISINTPIVIKCWR